MSNDNKKVSSTLRRFEQEMHRVQEQIDFIDTYQTVSAQIEKDAERIDQWIEEDGEEGRKMAEDYLTNRLYEIFTDVFVGSRKKEAA